MTPKSPFEIDWRLTDQTSDCLDEKLNEPRFKTLHPSNGIQIPRYLGLKTS